MKDRILNFGYRILNSRYFSMLFGSYRIVWELAGITRKTAEDAILRKGGNEDAFYLSGKNQAEVFKDLITKDSVVLDLGCGIGRVEMYLAEYCREIHGVDISWSILRLAKDNLKDHKNVFFHRNNGKDLRIFPDNKFDFIFSLLVLQHLEKEDAYIYLEEICRVLEPEGKVFLHFHNLLSDEVFGWFRDYARNKSRHIARARGYTAPEVEKMMISAGFDDLEIIVDGNSIFVTGSKPDKVSDNQDKI
ncbi:Ubiquinone/menaquinone biosynthesis C-methyltransferase UbiE [uncultured archaeon]|nr:Ubiquinone/menaquinone biosynthesis C-methyltransferase UbiE [uncultured archaeon]